MESIQLPSFLPYFREKEKKIRVTSKDFLPNKNFWFTVDLGTGKLSGALPISNASRQHTWESPIGLLFSWGT